MWWMALRKAEQLSKPQFPHLKKGTIKAPAFSGGCVDSMGPGVEHLAKSLARGKCFVKVYLEFSFRSHKIVCFTLKGKIVIRDISWSTPLEGIFVEVKSCLPILQIRQLSPRKSKRLLTGSRCGIQRFVSWSVFRMFH